VHDNAWSKVWVPRTVSRPLISAFMPAEDLTTTVQRQSSMIARCGLRTRLLDSRSPAELAGAPRPLRRGEGRRDPDATTRGRGTAPQQRPADTDLARPRHTQRAEQVAAYPAAPTAAGLAPNLAALAPPARRPPLDLPAPTTRPTTHRSADPSSGAADGPREPRLGLQKDSGRTVRTRPYRSRLDGLDDSQERGTRSSAPTIRPDLATVPLRPGVPGTLTLSPARVSRLARCCGASKTPTSATATPSHKGPPARQTSTPWSSPTHRSLAVWITRSLLTPARWPWAAPRRAGWHVWQCSRGGPAGQGLEVVDLPGVE
jgi:hypothetical protein